MKKSRLKICFIVLIYSCFIAIYGQQVSPVIKNNIYRNNNYYLPDIQRQSVKSDMIKTFLHNQKFNIYSVQYSILPEPYFMPVSMSVFPKMKYVNLRPGKPDIFKQNKQPYELLPHHVFMNQVNRTFQERPHRYEELVRNLSKTSPSLVDNLWSAIPDPPKVQRRNLDKKREKISEMLTETIQDTPIIPGKLNKFEAKKPKWKFSGSEHLTFSQTYIKNWVQGGESSQALQSDLNIKGKYTEDNTQWQNEMRQKVGLLAYKMLNEKGDEIQNTRINEDLFELSSQYSYKAGKKWDYSLLFKLRTQLFNGYSAGDWEKKEPKSAFLSPGYVTMAAGMSYKTGKNDNFTLLIAPVTGEIVMVINTAKVNQTQFSIDKDSKAKFDLGASLTNSFSGQISKDIKVNSSAYLFYDYFEKNDKIKFYQDLTIEMRINVFLSVRITANFRYYENELRKLQVKENMGISFRYTFNNI